MKRKNIKKYFQEPATNLIGIFMDFIPEKLNLKNLNFVLLFLIATLIFYLFGIQGIWRIFWLALWVAALGFAINFFWKKHKSK